MRDNPSSPTLPPQAVEGRGAAHHPAELPEQIRRYAREMRARMTDAEALLWKLLRNRRVAGAKFRRQHPLGHYILDFYCVQNKLAIELDGGQHHETVTYDKTRDEWLKSKGIQVLRFWDNQMLTETEAVMETIYQAVADTGRQDTLSAHDTERA